MMNVSAWVSKLTYDSDAAATMTSSDANLNAVWELCRYTIEAGALDMWTDSNARQRSIDCAADDVTVMQGQYATSNELALQLFHSGAKVQELRADWEILRIIQVRNHVLHTGDLDLAARTFDFMVANLSNAHLISKTSGLVEGQQCLVDWPKGMQDNFVSSETSTITSAWVYYGLTALVDLAG